MNSLWEGSKSHIWWELHVKDWINSPFSLACELWVPACLLQMTFSEKSTTTVGSQYPPAESPHSLSQDVLLHVFSNQSFPRNLSFSYFSYPTSSCFFLFMLFVVWLWSCLGHSALWHFCLKEILFINTCEKCYWVGTHWKMRSISFQFKTVCKTHLRNRCTHGITPVESNQIK